MHTIILDNETLQKSASDASPSAADTTLPPIQVQSEEQLDLTLQAEISQLELLMAGEDRYLSADNALEAAAAILLGVQGIQTEADYLDVQEALDRVCAICGFGSEVELNPPTVPFHKRGRYRQKIEIDPKLIPSAVQFLLSGHTTWMGTPYHYIGLTKVIDQIAQDIFGKERYRLHAGELKFLNLAISTTMEAHGWETVSGKSEDGTGRYLSDIELFLKKGMEPDHEAFKLFLSSFLRNQSGARVPKSGVKQAGCRGAFAPSVTSDPDNFIPNSWWHETLKEHGYMSTCRNNDDWLYPIPLDVPDHIDLLITQAIGNLMVRTANSGPLKGLEYILADELIFNLGGEVPELLPALKDNDQLDKVLDALEKETGWTKRLIKAGYNPERRLIFKRDLDLTNGINSGNAFLEANATKEIKHAFICYKRLGGISKQPKTVALAEGLRVKCLDLTRDSGGNLVYMRLIGPRSSVNANWAVVRGRRPIHCLSGTLVPPAKASALTLKKVLPMCGWDDWIIIHHQASLEKMAPGLPFYCPGEGYSECDAVNDLSNKELDEGHNKAINHKTGKEAGKAESSLLSNFFMRLTKSLSTPLLQAWGDYLWQEGITAGLISPLEEKCHGLVFWEVEPDEEKWGQIVQVGLQTKQIHLGDFRFSISD
jgi:hypothetical protein